MIIPPIDRQQPRVAVLGCGYWGRNLVRNFQALGVLATVCDSTAEGRELAASFAPSARIVDDAEDVWADSGINGVVVATPAETHAVLCQQALERGKDVFCEKPLALRYEDALRSAELAHARGLILMVGHVLEYHPAIEKTRELVETGQLGKVRYIYSNRLNLGKIRREENILWSFAPHDIAVILRLVGGLPFQVVAAGGAYIQPNIADVTVTQLLFDNGTAAHIFVSWLNPFKEQKLVVVGSQKMLTFDDVRKELVLHDQRVDVDTDGPIAVRGQGTAIAFSADEPLRRECEAFIEAMSTRRQPLTDAGSALRVQRVLQAAQRSLITQGQAVALPM
jgi:predicted dehydrogenase